MPKLKIALVDFGTRDRVSWWWRQGAVLYARAFDDVVRCVSAEDVAKALRRYLPGALAEVQFWGHSAPGVLYVNGKPLTIGDEWRSLEGGVLWARSCRSALPDSRGVLIATRLQTYGAGFAGHRGLIGALGAQSYLVGCRPGQAPWWPTTDPGGSLPWKPRTVLATTTTLPAWAFG